MALLFLVYFAVPKGAKNYVLLAFSMLFYAWGEPKYAILMVVSIMSGWVFALLIEKFNGTKKAKLFLWLANIVLFGFLAVFKYADFAISTINGIFSAEIPLLKLALPIGISFYTFQIVSYVIDVYRGEVEAQKNPFTLATYVALFPQLIAGPIVRYQDVNNELVNRKHTTENFAAGAMRFAAGLAKKVLISNALGELCEIYKTSTEKTVLFTWIYAIAYAFHIYFDFSGYSDMAIGLGRIFGFKFLENFNYPYIARSVTEFWRRWHISLSTWFRDYVYIPLGGNRCSTARHIFNICVVWAFTGLWHGAGFNFIMWGVWFALLLIIEKFFLGKLLKKITPVAYIYTMLAVIFSWILFDAATLGDALVRIGNLFGAGGIPAVGTLDVYYLKSYAVVLIIAAIGSTPLPKKIYNKLMDKAPVLTWVQPVLAVLSLVVCSAYLIDGSFNPFIYFRF